MLNSPTILALSHIPLALELKPPDSSSNTRSTSCRDLNDQALEAVMFFDVGGLRRDDDKVLINFDAETGMKVNYDVGLDRDRFHSANSPLQLFVPK